MVQHFLTIKKRLVRTQPMKNHGLFDTAVSHSLSLSIKAVFFSYTEALAQGSLWVQTLNCNSLLIPNKPIFPG